MHGRRRDETRQDRHRDERAVQGRRAFRRDHIIPRAVVPELDTVIANLELMPLRMNESKNDQIDDRRRDMAKKFY